MKPYYQEPGITIYEADCRDVIPDLSPVDLVITSPPYNLGGSPWPHLGHWKVGDSPGGKSKWRGGSDGSGGGGYASYEDNMPHDQYVVWQREILALLWSRLTESGAIFYNHKPRVIGERAWLPIELNPELPLRQIITWARAGGINFAPTHYVPTYEWILVFAKPAFRLRDKAASGAGDLWYIPQEIGTPHPAPFPVRLPKQILSTTAATSVLDPFMGSGTTAVACKAAGVPFVGVEINERYCELAASRLAQGALDLEATA